jgi:hypothetical protein
MKNVEEQLKAIQQQKETLEKETLEFNTANVLNLIRSHL